MSNTIFNIHDALLLATTFQSISFVLLIVMLKRDLHLSDSFLIGFFLVQALIPIHLLITYGDEFQLIALEFSPNLFRVFDVAYWVEGPLLLWYTRSLLFKEFHLTRTDSIFLFPAILYVLYGLVTFYSWDNADKVSYITGYMDLQAPSIPHTLDAIRETLFVVFGILCLIEIRHAQQQVHHRYSNIEKIDFMWLGLLVAAFILLRSWTLLVTGMAFLKPDLGFDIFNRLGLVGNYLTFAVVNTLIFFSLTRSTVFAGKISKSHVHTGNDEIDIDPELTEKIRRHMEQNKPFLSHYLNLEELANQLSMHPRALSVAIKNNFQTNFYEFINSYRIDEAKQLLEDSSQPNRTMIDILGEAGFNSKATFNAFFKKMVGMTPTQYRQSMLAKQ